MTSFRLASAAVAAMLAAFAAGVSSPPAASAQSGPAKIEPMSDQRFWDLIGLTTAFESDPERQMAALRAALAPLPLGEIEAFQAAFNRAMARSYS